MCTSEHSVLNVYVLEAWEKVKCKDLSEFDKGQIVIATGSVHLQNCSYFGVSCSAVVSISQTWSKKSYILFM